MVLLLLTSTLIQLNVLTLKKGHRLFTGIQFVLFLTITICSIWILIIWQYLVSKYLKIFLWFF